MGMFLGGLNEFETMLIDTSVFRVLFDMPNLIPGVSFSRVRYLEHYLQTNYILENLPKIPKSGTPLLLFTFLYHMIRMFILPKEHTRKWIKYQGISEQCPIH